MTAPDESALTILSVAEAQALPALRDLIGPDWPTADYKPGQSDMAIALREGATWASWARVLVATAPDGMVLGWALATQIADDADRGLVDAFVTPSARRTGLGGKLWREAARMLVHRGCGWVCIDRNPWGEALAAEHIKRDGTVFVCLYPLQGPGFYESMWFGGWVDRGER